MDLIEIIIHPCDANDPVDTTLPSDDEREKQWRVINAPYTNITCSACVLGVQNMDDGIPTYCSCILGRQHVNTHTPWYVHLSNRVTHTLRRWVKN